MTDPRELLDAAAKEGAGEYGERVEETAPGLVAALRAVLDLHAPETVDADPTVPARQVCTDCCPYDNEWPCDTVRAITTALEAS